ncbi:MAG TPA: S1 RNA-binding domain-containing protein, partial [Candidatus Eremiobacteraceae bacterium]|nr:S1 RNA-binding domain-containing protein [Candidatus Eremiobacteraceae bacterium]
DPWKNVPDQLVEGTVVPATLIKVTQNYLLVEILPGVTGMVPKSEFDGRTPPATGETVQVRLLSINVPSRRITASVTKASGNGGGNPEVAEFLASQQAQESSIGDALDAKSAEPSDATGAPEPPDASTSAS